MTSSKKYKKILGIFGILYFFGNFVFFAAILFLAIATSRDSQQLFPSALLSLFPGIGMLSGYWIRAGKYGWARSFVIAISLVVTAVGLYIAFVTGPQLDTLKAEKFAKLQKQKQTQLDEDTQRLFLGIYSGDIGIVKEQLKKGVAVSVRNETRQTPLHITQDTEIARLLIELGADVNATDDMGMTPISNKEIEIATLLLAAGADVNARGEKGNTPFLWYSYSGYLDGLKLLVNSGADITACNDDNNNAFNIAEHFQPNTESFRYLSTLKIPACK